MSIINNIYKKSKRLFRIPKKKKSDVVKWGIIGLGYMAEVMASTIDNNVDGQVVAVASRTIEKAKKFAKKHHVCSAYGSYKEMLEDSSIQLDVIYIATPTKYHYDNIKECLLAQKNVLCEKPITSNMEQLEELIQIAKDNSCFLMEGMWMKCLPTYQKALEWVKEDRIGDVELVRVDFYKRQVIDPRVTNFNSSEGGGVMKDYGVYAISFPLDFFTGDVESIAYESRCSITDIDSDWNIILKSANVKAFINISSNFSSSSKAAVIGNEGSIEWDSQFNRTNTIKLYDRRGEIVQKFVVPYKDEGFEYEVNEVHKCIKNKNLESDFVPLISTMKTLQIMDELLCKK